MRILFLDILTDQPAFREEAERDILHGTYSELFRTGLGSTPDTWATVDASRDPFPSLSSFDGLVIGGSMENAVLGQEKPWMQQTYQHIRETIEAKKPVFGVCGGLQFTVRALGGMVIKNPMGRNFGLSSTKLTEAGRRDPLLSKYGNGADVLASHSYRAADLPAGCHLLSSAPKSPFDAIGYQSHVRLVQFHPEFTPEIVSRLAHVHRTTLIEDGHVSEEGFADYIAKTRDLRHTGHELLSSIVPFFEEVKERSE